MSEIKINTGKKIQKHASLRIYPFMDMQVGDYFTFDISKAAVLRQLAYRHSKKYGKKFTTATKDGKITVTRLK